MPATEPVPTTITEPPPEAQAPEEIPAIDVIITTFDQALNDLRQHAGALKDSTTTKSINDCLKAFVAAQSFMREIRRLLGDIL